ncbi:DUF6350 family protein [Demequina sp.]|uniref:cell division protein PerM n=1 Tax=Demequina sp. TaxID=2050685 RepID=UPI003A83E3BE
MSTRSLASDARALGRRALAAVMAAPAWLGGILTGVQGAVLGYLLLLAPAMAVVAASPDSSLTTGVDWSAPADFALRVWLLGHGLAVSIDGVAFSLIPLGLTLLFGFILAGVARRFAARSWGSWALAVATYAGLVGAAAWWVLDPPDRHAIVLPVVIAAALASVAVAAGIWRAHGAVFGWVPRVPEFVRVGVRRAGALAALGVAIAAAAQIVWAALGAGAIGDAATALDLDPVGATVLAVGELAYVPTMVIWSLAWLAGPGFAVGTGTAFAPDTLTAGAEPGFPILGALPSAAGGWLVWAPVALVVVAVVVRVWLRRGSLGWERDAGADLIAVGLIGVAGSLACALATGAIGPGRLATVGPDPLPVTVALMGLTALGLALGTGGLLIWRTAVDQLPDSLARRLQHQPADARVTPVRKPAPASAVSRPVSRPVSKPDSAPSAAPVTGAVRTTEER